MRTLMIVFLVANFATYSQGKFEIKEFSGKVIGIQPGWGFALEIIEVQTDDGIHPFKLDPTYGTSILSQIKIGESITLKAKTNQTLREILKKTKSFPAALVYRFADEVTEIRIKNEWVGTPSQSQTRNQNWSSINWKILLEEPIKADYKIEGVRKGLIFRNGVVAFSTYASLKLNSMEHLDPGKVVSFMGSETPKRENYLYPIQDVNRVLSFVELTKIEGTIQTFIYKQNFVRIGLTIQNKRLSFPSEFAKTIDAFADGSKVTVYYNGLEDSKTNLLPTIHAILHERDTLYIPGLYYGGPDGSHEYKPAELESIISKVNRNEKGRITSLLTADDCFIEIDSQIADQMNTVLKKGSKIKISGQERVKKDGEIYEKNYRIITPKTILADGKEFILTPQ